MIEPTQDDIGKKVVYTVPQYHRHNLGGFKSADEFVEEVGVITSYNDSFVFVQYIGDQTSKATRRCDLRWKGK